MIQISTAAQNIVDNNLRKAKRNDSMIINSGLSFSEWFQESLTDTEVDTFQKQFPNLDINNEGVEAQIDANFLFINREGYYSCFYNIENRDPLFKNESQWTFTTNHDTCWRVSAFSDAENAIFEIRNDISKLSAIRKLEHISIPKHVIPNYASISNSEIFTFEDINTSENYKNNQHVLVTTENGRALTWKKDEEVA